MNDIYTKTSDQHHSMIATAKERGFKKITSNFFKSKKRRRDKSDLGENFIAPDGGWGWIVVMTSGFSFLVTLPIMQQFGIIFRDKFKDINISNTEITTIINTQAAASTFIGFFNGPLFRRFSIRQVALIGAVLTSIGLGATVFADSFLFYFLSLSVVYGIGKGLMFSASGLVVNIYFNTKRRAATAYQLTVAGLGQVLLPYVSTFLLIEYGVAGSVLLFAGLSLHNLVCAISYQPVQWHVKKSKTDKEIPILSQAENEFSMNSPKIEVSKENHSLSIQNLPSLNEPLQQRPNKEPEETEFLQRTGNEEKRLSVLKKIVLFFDLDLLKDLTYVNLALGLTMIHFTEMNFAFLTPFILAEFNFDRSQVAAAMTTLAASDMATRFMIPVITAKLKFSNKVFLLGSVVGSVFGRALLVNNNNFTVLLVSFGWMGFNKAIRLVFSKLILPSYVPLKRLPAASGLQRSMLGLFTFIFGPLIGLIRDYTNHTFTIHWMNGVLIVVLCTWVCEDVYKSYKRRNISETQSSKEEGEGSEI